jgi:hypothetical protein
MAARSSTAVARGVPLDRQPRIRRFHPFPVVLDPDLLLAAELDVNGQALRTGVDRVLDQLLDDGGRALDDLAGGYLVGEVRGQAGDLSHLKSTVWT